jgi:hypothetical protein
MMTTVEMVMYDQLVELGIATPDELNLAFNMTDIGWTRTLNKVLYIRTGFRTIAQMLEAEDEEEL